MKNEKPSNEIPFWEDRRKLAMLVKSFQDMKERGLTSEQITKYPKRRSS